MCVCVCTAGVVHVYASPLHSTVLDWSCYTERWTRMRVREASVWGDASGWISLQRRGSSYPTADARPPPPTQIRLCRSAPNGRDGSERKEGEKRTVALASCVYKMACIPTFVDLGRKPRPCVAKFFLSPRKFAALHPRQVFNHVELSSLVSKLAMCWRTSATSCDRVSVLRRSFFSSLSTLESALLASSMSSFSPLAELSLLLL